MGIFDAVLGKKDTGGGLFSKKSAFVEKGPNVLAAPPPATAHLAALRARASRGGGAKRDAASDDDSDSDSDSDDGKRRKKSDKQSAAARRAEERASVEEAYEAAAAVMNDGSGGAKREKGKRDAAAASDTDDEDDSSSSESRDSDDGSEDGSDSESERDRSEEAPRENDAREANAPNREGAPKTTQERTDAEDALRRTIFVGNLPVNIKTKKLRAAFAPFGAVTSVRLRSVPVDQEGKMPKAGKVITGALVAERKSTNAYVVFENEASVAKAIAAMNMKPIEGRHARVDAAAAPSSRANEAKAKALSADLPPGVGITNGGEVAYDHARALFLGNLAYDVDEEDVIAFFHRSKEYPELAGSVEAVRVVRDRATNLGKGIAFVLFRKTGDARVGLLLDGAKIGEREVRVARAAKNRAAAAAGAAAKRKAREEKARPSGAARRLRLESGAGGDAGGWEGSRSRPGGKRQKTAFDGGAAAAGAGRAGGRGGGAGGRGGKSAAARTGKRPAVAARKAKAKAKAAGEKKRS